MIFFILFTALILRLILIDQSFWLDEAIEILAVKNYSYTTLITQYSLGDFHPPMYHLILKFWTGIFGYSEIGARSLSVVFGILTIYFIYKIAKFYLSKKNSLLAAGFIALSPLHVYYSQEARMYAAAAFFVSVSVYYFLKLLKEEKLSNWIYFLTSVVLFLYTDYLPHLMLAVFNIFIFWKWKELNSVFKKRWLLTQIVFAVCITFWLPFFIKQLEIGLRASNDTPLWGEVVGGFSLKALPLTAAKFIIGRISFYNKILYSLIFFTASLLVAFLILQNIKNLTKEKILLGLWLIVPLTLGWLISLFIPIYSYFRFLFVLPAMYLFLASGIETFKSKNTRYFFSSLIIIVNLISLFVFWLNPRFHHEDWKTAVSWIEDKAMINSAAIFVTDNQTAPYKYYAKQTPFYGPIGWENKDLKQVFLMRYVQPIFDPDDNLKSIVESKGYKKIEEKDFNGVTIWHYQI